MERRDQNSSQSFANSIEGIWRWVQGRFVEDAVRLRSHWSGGQPPHPRDISTSMKGACHAEA